MCNGTYGRQHIGFPPDMTTWRSSRHPVIPRCQREDLLESVAAGGNLLSYLTLDKVYLEILPWFTPILF